MFVVLLKRCQRAALDPPVSGPHRVPEAGVQPLLSEDVQPERPGAEQDGRLHHGEGLLHPVAAGNHRQVHAGRPGPAGRTVGSALPHDVPEGGGRGE